MQFEREPEAAWVHFKGWRVNYEEAAYALAATLDVVPALWSGPRLRPGMVLAIEPMINAGSAEVKVLEDGWTAVTHSVGPWA